MNKTSIISIKFFNPLNHIMGCRQNAPIKRIGEMLNNILQQMPLRR